MDETYPKIGQPDAENQTSETKQSLTGSVQKVYRQGDKIYQVMDENVTMVKNDVPTTKFSNADVHENADEVASGESLHKVFAFDDNISKEETEKCLAFWRSVVEKNLEPIKCSLIEDVPRFKTERRESGESARKKSKQKSKRSSKDTEQTQSQQSRPVNNRWFEIMTELQKTRLHETKLLLEKRCRFCEYLSSPSYESADPVKANREMIDELTFWEPRSSRRRDPTTSKVISSQFKDPAAKRKIRPKSLSKSMSKQQSLAKVESDCSNTKEIPSQLTPIEEKGKEEPESNDKSMIKEPNPPKNDSYTISKVGPRSPSQLKFAEETKLEGPNSIDKSLTKQPSPSKSDPTPVENTDSKIRPSKTSADPDQSDTVHTKLSKDVTTEKLYLEVEETSKSLPQMPSQLQDQELIEKPLVEASRSLPQKLSLARKSILITKDDRNRSESFLSDSSWSRHRNLRKSISVVIACSCSNEECDCEHIVEVPEKPVLPITDSDLPQITRKSRPTLVRVNSLELLKKRLSTRNTIELQREGEDTRTEDTRHASLYLQHRSSLKSVDSLEISKKRMSKLHFSKETDEDQEPEPAFRRGLSIAFE